MRNFVIIGSFLFVTQTGFTGDLILVNKGNKRCVVVTGKSDGLRRLNITRVNSKTAYRQNYPLLREAAEDFTQQLQQIGGIKLDGRGEINITEKTPRPTGRIPTRILLGKAAIEQYSLQDEASKLGYNDYIYRVKRNDLLIFGRTDKGTANGIYGFLQDELNARWFGPQKGFSILPHISVIKVPRTLNKTVKPAFEGLQMYMGQQRPILLWGLRQRINIIGDTYEPFCNASHNLWRIFPLKTYQKNKPEYYQMVGGKRRFGSRNKNFGLCWSNPEIVDIAANKIKKYFKASPYHQSYSLGINDTLAFCECPKCAKLQPKRIFRGKMVASDMYFHFVNQVAKKVGKIYPDRVIGVIAYNDITAPPQGKVEKNIFVLITNDISEYYNADYRKEAHDLIKKWSEKGVKIGLYYYTSLAKLVPAYFGRMLVNELQWAHKHNVVALFCEASPGWPWFGPMIYMDAQVRWNIKLNPDAVLTEYCTKLFGPAAKPMKSLYDLLEDIHLRPRKGGFFYEHYSMRQLRPYTATDLHKLRECLKAAHAACKGLGTRTADNHFASNVAYVSNGMKVFLDLLAGKVLAEELSNAKAPLGDIEIYRRLDLINKIMDIIERQNQIYRETIINDELQAGRFRGDTVVSLRNEWKSTLRNVIGAELVRIKQQLKLKKKR